MLGGSSVSAKRFIRGLTDRGHEIMLITNSIDKKNIDDPLLLNVRMEVSGNIPIIQNDKFAFSNIDPFKIDRLFDEFKPELVYSIYPTSFSAYRAVRSARRLQIPVIGHFHVQIENISSLLQKFRFVEFVYKLFLPLYNMYDLILCPSVFAQGLLNHHEIKVPTEVISNGVDLNRFKKMSEQEISYVYEKFSISKNKFNILYIGRLDKEKDMMTLLSGFKEVLNYTEGAQLIIGGIGCDYDLIKKFIEDNNLRNSIKLLGRVPDTDLVALYNIGNVFVSASFCELEGMTLLEAMACGLPLIVSDADTSAARFLISENGLTFKSKDHVDLSTKIINLMVDQLPRPYGRGMLKCSLGEKSEHYKSTLQNFAQQSLENSLNYNFEKSVDKLETVFNEAVYSKSKQKNLSC